MIALVGPAEVLRIRECIAFARANPKQPTPDGPVPGDDPRHLVELDVGVRCVLTFDDGDEGLWRHLSVSQASRRIPNPAGLRGLAMLFGFTDRMVLLGPLPVDAPWVVHCIERVA